MEIKEMLYEGKAKQVFATEDPRDSSWSTIRTTPRPSTV